MLIKPVFSTFSLIEKANECLIFKYLTVRLSYFITCPEKMQFSFMNNIRESPIGRVNRGFDSIMGKPSHEGAQVSALLATLPDKNGHVSF